MNASSLRQPSQNRRVVSCSGLRMIKDDHSVCAGSVMLSSSILVIPVSSDSRVSGLAPNEAEYIDGVVYFTSSIRCLTVAIVLR